MEATPKKAGAVGFNFPDDHFGTQVFTSISSLREALNHSGQDFKNTFKLSHNSRYVSLKCKVNKCQAKITFKKERVGEEGEILLKNLRFNNYHIHSSKFHFSNNTDHMLDFLKKFDMTIISKDSYKVLHGQFGISHNQYYNIRRKLTHRIPIPELIENLKAKNYLVGYEEWP